MIIFPPFQIGCYRFDLEAIDKLHLPIYKGSTLRGGFGHAFKRMVCRQKDWQACTPCQDGNACPYGYIFETSAPEESQLFSTIRDVPTPFVIEPPLESRQLYNLGDRISFNVILIGRAINYLPYFVLAFQELGRAGIGRSRGRYVIQRVSATDPWEQTRHLVYDGVDLLVGGEQLVLDNDAIAKRAASFRSDQLTIQFVTPTKLVHAHRLAKEPDFHIIVRKLLQRISSLLYFHCEQRWDTEYAKLINLAKSIEIRGMETDWTKWQRFSGRQRRHIPMEGLVGQATYHGNWVEFAALLSIGELVHVGKATTFGHGKFLIKA
jgi:hypothetical protein